MKRIKGIAVLIGLLVSALSLNAGGPPPQVVFKKDGIRVKGGKPGGSVVWLAVVRDRVKEIGRVRALRGVAVSNALGDSEISVDKADEMRGIWLVADIDSGAAGHVRPPSQDDTAASVVVTASVSQAAFAVNAPEATVMYARPKVGAWTFTAADGSPADADGLQNGVVLIALSSLEAFEGKKKPPSQTEAGDVVIAIDRRWMLVGQVEVMQ